jgi:hypothetical protein
LSAKTPAAGNRAGEVGITGNSGSQPRKEGIDECPSGNEGFPKKDYPNVAEKIFENIYLDTYKSPLIPLLAKGGRGGFDVRRI